MSKCKYNFFTKEQLVTWIVGLKKSVERDENFSISWFGPTKNMVTCIVGGWSAGFNPADADLFCLSRSNPTFGMCVKVVVNPRSDVLTDFDRLDMPVDSAGEIEDSTIVLEHDMDIEGLADFITSEWDRLICAAIDMEV